MLHELIPLLPTRLTTAPPDVLGWSALAGLLLGWLGARFSRSMLTLAAVAAGAWVGIRLPAALHWSIDPMCLGVAGAIVLGTAAYLLHRTLVAVALGGVLALWALAITWVTGRGGVQWDPSGLHWSGDAVLYLNQLWHSLPGDLGKLIPCFCGGALAVGLLTGAVLPRLSRCLLYGIAGPTLALATAVPLAVRLRPDWLALVPESAGAQGGPRRLGRPQSVGPMAVELGAGEAQSEAAEVARRQDADDGQAGGEVRRAETSITGGSSNSAGMMT